MANILAEPLRALAPEIAKRTHFGADIILSGLIARDVQGVIAAYRMQAIFLVRRIEIDGWATLLMQRGQRSRKSGKVLSRAKVRRRRENARLCRPAISKPSTTKA